MFELMSDLLVVAVYGATAVGLIIAPIWGRRVARRRKVRLSGGSVLLAFYAEGPTMMPVAHGTVAGLHYTSMANLAKGAGFYQVELPFSAKIHLVNIPKRDAVVQLDPTGANSVMEHVVLEGDYNDKFTMFCEKGEQQQARYVMDPAAMVFSMDFCASHNWEIIHNMLYFVQASPDVAGDPTHMFDDIARFVEEIRPRVARPLTDAERSAAAPYGHDRREGLKCPVCQAALVNNSTYYACPSGHGLLIMGRVLTGLRKGALKVEQHGDAAPARRGDIACPSCGETMHQVPFNGDKATIIDSCAHCPYRWIDGADLPGIAKPY